MTLKVHVEIKKTKNLCGIMYISDKGLEWNERKKLEGKFMIDIFPRANENWSIENIIGLDATKVPIVILPDDEFNNKFPYASGLICRNCGHVIAWEGLVHCRELDCSCLKPEPKKEELK